MPKATVNVQDTERYELKTLEDGFVILRRMTFGQKLQRRSMTNLKVTAQKGQKDFQGELALMDRKVTEFEFQHCIVDHNLEDEGGNKLQFPRDLDRLDPRIGDEINGYISDMNNFEESDEGN